MTKTSREERKRMAVEYCRGKRVLHLGCTDWPFTADKIRDHELLHAQLAECAKDIIGVDICDEGLELLRRCNPNWKLVSADACEYHSDFEADIVIASELIEHLENPGQMLRCIASYAKPETELLITTNNAQSLKSALRAVVGKEECHPDHTLLFTTKTMTQLLKRTGWDVVDIQYYRVAAERPLMAVLSGCLRLLELVGSPQMREGLVVLARPQAAQTQRLSA